MDGPTPRLLRTVVVVFFIFKFQRNVVEERAFIILYFAILDYLRVEATSLERSLNKH